MRCRKNGAAVLGIGAFVLLGMFQSAIAQQSDLEVLTLQQAERIALENHPGIRAAKERVKVQEAMVTRAKAGWYPTAGVRGSYENKPATENPNADKNLFSTSGQVEWLVSDFGRREGNIRREEGTLEARRFLEKTSMPRSVVLAVRQAFFNYLRAEALVRVEQDTVKDRETLVRQAQGFFDVGTRPKIDVARAEASLFAAKAGLIAAQNGVKIAWARLKSAMGVSRFPERRVASDVNVRPSALSLDDAVKAAFESRTEIKEFQSRLKAQQEAIDVVKRGRMPRLRFNGQYGRRLHNDQDIISSTLIAGSPPVPGLHPQARDRESRPRLRGHQGATGRAAATHRAGGGRGFSESRGGGGADPRQRGAAEVGQGEPRPGQRPLPGGSGLDHRDHRSPGHQHQGPDRPHTVHLRPQGGGSPPRPGDGPGFGVQPVAPHPNPLPEGEGAEPIQPLSLWERVADGRVRA